RAYVDLHAPPPFHLDRPAHGAARSHPRAAPKIVAPSPLPQGAAVHVVEARPENRDHLTLVGGHVLPQLRKPVKHPLQLLVQPPDLQPLRVGRQLVALLLKSRNLCVDLTQPVTAHGHPSVPSYIHTGTTRKRLPF